jgi:hypothetical protein
MWIKKQNLIDEFLKLYKYSGWFFYSSKLWSPVTHFVFEPEKQTKYVAVEGEQLFRNYLFSYQKQKIIIRFFFPKMMIS